MTMRALGSMGSAGSMPDTMDRRDFLIRMAIGAAFALAGVPLIGQWLAEWAERRQRHDAIVRQLQHQAEQAMSATMRKVAHQLYGDQYGASTRPLRHGDTVAIIRDGRHVGILRLA